MPDAKVPALMAPSAVEERSKLGTDLGNAAAAGPAVEPISAMQRLKQDALLFSILSIVFGVVFLGAYFSIYRTGNGGDKLDDEDDDSVPLDKFTNPMFHRFFDEACLRDSCGVDAVAENLLQSGLCRADVWRLDKRQPRWSHRHTNHVHDVLP